MSFLRRNSHKKIKDKTKTSPSPSPQLGSPSPNSPRSASPITPRSPLTDEYSDEMQRNGRGNETRTHSFDSGRDSYDHVSGKDYYHGNGDHDEHKTKGMNVQMSELEVQFLLPNGQVLMISCSIEDTVQGIMGMVHEEASRLKDIHVSKHNLKPIENYVSKMPGNHGIITDESVTIGSLPYIQACRNSSTTPRINLQEKNAVLSKKDKHINVEIGSLVGTPLCWTQPGSEIDQFRKSMLYVRYQEHIKRAGGGPAITRSSVKKGIVGGETKVMVKLLLPLLESAVEKTVIANDPPGESCNQFIERMAAKYYKNTTTPNGFTLKISGIAEFIDGEDKLVETDYFQEILSCTTKKMPQLSLVAKEETTEEESFPEEQYIVDATISYEHNEIASSNIPWDKMTCLSVWEISTPFRFRVLGVENVKKFNEYDGRHMYVTAEVYHGGESIDQLMTSSTHCCVNPRWEDWLSTSTQLCNIPRAARVCFTLYCGQGDEQNPAKDKPAGWVAYNLFDYKHELRTGVLTLSMWQDDKANPIGTCVGNTASDSPTLYIEVASYQLPVVFPTLYSIDPSRFRTDSDMKQHEMEDAVKRQTIQTFYGADIPAKIEAITSRDPLSQLSEEDKNLLWAEREYCRTNHTKALPKLLRSVAYNNRFSVHITHQLLERWDKLSAEDGLELLDSNYGDSKVRQFAVECLEQFTDEQLATYLLQLVQVLKYEPYHDSALCRFLLRRALSGRGIIGHSLFWYLKSEMHQAEISERYGLLLEAYLRGCGAHRAELGRQVQILNRLVKTANHIKTVKDPSDRLKVLQQQLEAQRQFPKLKLPLNPMIEVSGIVVQKCKFMDSKKLPLWLVFNNADARSANQYVILKSGDDLRQDMLTLQMIRLMDRLWKCDNLDLRLNPYGCISTGFDQGMIEIVLNSDTVANITKKYGGATAAFRVTPIADWLQKQNGGADSEQYALAVDNFVHSCAGYCVATYVLGIGDRHNDNVMITKEGKLFHIDFGHFLGNYKKKFGFKRERAPFVFTPDFAYVMGGKDSKDFNRFVDLCCDAYNILRRHSHLFINLFAMMLSTGIPELKSAEDIEYLRDAFSLGQTEEDAREKFIELIYESLGTKTTQLNNAIHIWAH